MIKYITLFMAAVIFLSCAGQPVRVGTGYGKETTLRSVKHDKPEDNYYIKTLLIQINKIEINFNEHEYHVYPEKKFSNMSAGAKYHFNKKWGYFLVDAGLGFKLTETDGRNKWLVEKPFLADFSLSTGIEKKLSKYGLKIQCLYEFQHLSGVGDDQGLNYDKGIILFSIPF